MVSAAAQGKCVGDLLACLIANSAEQMEVASGSGACTQALQLLWIALTLLLRRPPPRDDRRAPADGREGGDLSLVAILRQRLACAERGEWAQPLFEYLVERAAMDRPERKSYADDLVGGRDRRAARDPGGCGVNEGLR